MTTTSSAPTMSPVAKIRALHDRLIKAEALVASGKVRPVYGIEDHYFVEGSKDVYLVNGVCHCPDATNRPELKWCKHRLSVEIFKEQQTIAEDPKVAKATTKANTTPPETDPELERQIQELYN
jgi:hypothetical protein